MDFELRAAREKLERERERRERRERAKAKLERERKAKAEAARWREAIEAAQRIKRVEAADTILKVLQLMLAEQQMEETMLLGKGIIFCQTLEALPYVGYGDKIKLPPSCFTELSDQGALDKGPMHFRLSRVDMQVSLGSDVPSASDLTAKQYPGTTPSGVLEFTAREGSVELPPHMWSNLFSNDVVEVPLVEVCYVSLPKGTYAKLQHDRMGFSDIPNHKGSKFGWWPIQYWNIWFQGIDPILHFCGPQG